jgi:hypothetical protein
MITSRELQQYTTLDYKLDKFFRKLDNKVKKKASNGGKRFTVLVYDEFVPDGILSSYQQQTFHKELYEDYIINDPEVFLPNNRSIFMYAIQQKLVHEYGYSSVSWEDFNHKYVNNAMLLSFCW